MIAKNSPSLLLEYLSFSKSFWLCELITMSICIRVHTLLISPNNFFIIIELWSWYCFYELLVCAKSQVAMESNAGSHSYQFTQSEAVRGKPNFQARVTETFGDRYTIEIVLALSLYLFSSSSRWVSYSSLMAHQVYLTNVGSVLILYSCNGEIYLWGFNCWYAKWRLQ